MIGDISNDHIHAPRYFGPHAGIRCQTCNAVIEPDPAVRQTADQPWAPNTEALSAAVAARGGRCENCAHWTFAPVRPPAPGRPTVGDYCRNCAGLGDGSPEVVRMSSAAVPARLLIPFTGAGES